MVVYGQKRCLFVYPWAGVGAPETFAPLAAQPYSLFFDSATKTHPLARYSYLCWHPFETIESHNGHVTVTNIENRFTYRADVFQAIRERLSLWGDDFTTRQKNLPPFIGGAAGFFGYDLARGIEKLPPRKAGTSPDLCIGLYDKVLAFDHENETAYLMIWAVNEDAAQVQKTYLEKLVAQSAPVHPDSTPLEWATERNDQQFQSDIARVIDYIYAGDIFQANLSRRYSAQVPSGFNPYAHYLHLRDINPAPFAAYMNFDRTILSSCSPERFLEVKKRIVETRPIKGTLPSSQPVTVLEDSKKDRAENIMIVDLLRNDLSKVCEDHSVNVDNLCAIETFEGLHHMVSTISGTLRADQSAADALRACFPGGSITGAPKIRAMEIIDALEPDSRGAYCGAMGWIGFNGDMDTAITIRTLVYEGKTVHLQAGGGITALSDPAAEIAETKLKAAKIFESFCALATQEKKTA